MSTTSLSLTKAKELAINFIKKYKNVLRDGETCKPISNDVIAQYEAMTPSAFFTSIDMRGVQANFGSFFYVFNYDKSRNGRHDISVWLHEHSSAKDLHFKLDAYDRTNEELSNYWQNGNWYNLTETRMKALEKIFDQLSAKSKTKTLQQFGKKSVKKPEVVTISDTTEVQNEIAFVDFSAGKFDHLMNQGGDNFAPMISDASDLDAQNQIDHAINAFKLAKKELDVFINELVKAKAAGAKHVVDTSWCERKDFDFNK